MSVGSGRTMGRRSRKSWRKLFTPFAAKPLLSKGAGRTDAGVHALGQAAHVDIERDTDANTVRDALNAHLRPNPISVLQATAVSDEFHARFSATGSVLSLPDH